MPVLSMALPMMLGCSTSALPPIDPGEVDALAQRALEQTGAPGVALAIGDLATGEISVGTAGFADLDAERAWTSELPYPIGSVTKTFTAVWVLQLVEEGTLQLDDPLDLWVTTPWTGEGITVDHLLRHGSGIASYNWVGGFDGSQLWTPEQLVQWAADHEPALQFSPGTSFAYSNTGYVLLGMLAEQASGQPMADAFQERFFDPLGMTRTTVPTAHPAELVRGYQDSPPRDTTDEMHPSAAGAAGAIISTPEDVARWGTALFGGQVVAAETLTAMTTPMRIDGEEVGYGQGLFGGVDPDWGASWGHTGGYSGHLTDLTYMEDPNQVVVAMANSFEADLQTASNVAWFAILGL